MLAVWLTRRNRAQSAGSVEPERFTELLLPKPGAVSEILPMVQQRRYPKLYVDGPFGSSSEEVFNYEVSLCVAGGIGVTPFACVLRALLDGWKQFRLRRLYFVWVCRELQSFYWFSELLCALHHKLWQENRPDYLNLKLFVSKTEDLQSMSEEKYAAPSVRGSRLVDPGGSFSLMRSGTPISSE
ncbi:hypothetical protein CRUP_014120 [Coryphaenoides rupestris]|nr:hypothetical protein CRUP_014120 [Coryphaenoides rupestris]